MQSLQSVKSLQTLNSLNAVVCKNKTLEGLQPAKALDAGDAIF